MRGRNSYSGRETRVVDTYRMTGPSSTLLSPQAAGPSRLALQSFVMCTAMLLAIGTIMVFSASITAQPSQQDQIYLSRHLLFLTGGVGTGTIAALLPGSFWRSASPFLFLLTLAAIGAVLVPGIGTRVNGAQRWIRLGPISIQPSETAKITLTLLLARLVSTQRDKPTIGGRLLLAGTFLITAVLVVIEPDLGTTVFLTILFALVLFLGGWPIKEFVAAGVVTLPVIASVLVLKPYQWKRLEGFVTTWTHPEEAPYQVRQSLTTLGVGGLSGTGLGEGWQKLSFLPEANTDFIFSVIGEELGLWGTLGVAALWLSFFYFGLKLLRQHPTKSFPAIAGTALLCQLVIQAAINIGVVTAVLPPKGISHPFISYGGSSLIVSCAAVGIIISLASSPVEYRVSQLVDAEDTAPTDDDPEQLRTAPDGGTDGNESSVPAPFGA